MSKRGCAGQTLPSLGSVVSVPIQWMHDEHIAQQQEIVDNYRSRGEDPPKDASWAVEHQRLTRWVSKNILPLASTLLIRSIGRREACSWETPGGTIEFHSLANTVVSDIVDAAYMVAEGRSADVWSETQIGFSLATLLSAYRNGPPDGQKEEDPNDNGTPPISTSATRLAPANELDNPLDDDESAGYRFVMTFDPSQYCQANAGQDQGAESVISWPMCGVHEDQSRAGAGTAVGGERALAGLHFGWVLADQPDDEVKTSSDDQSLKSAIIPDMSLES